MVITSVENNKIKELSKLKESKYRKKNNQFIVEGYHLVEEANKYNRLEEVFILEDITYEINVPCTYVSKEVMKKLSSLDTIPDIIGICSIKDNGTINGKRILMLDRVQDPGNLGTIIRSSLAFNIDTIILSKDCVDLYNSKVIRSTQGMIFGINIITMNLIKAIDILKKDNIKIYGTRVDNGTDVSTLTEDEKNSFALIMGNEGQGVSSEILDLCDKYLYIKMNNNTESLNVAVATSIILYELDK